MSPSWTLDWLQNLQWQYIKYEKSFQLIWDENLTYLQLSSYLTPMNSPCRLQEWWTGPTGWRGNVAPQRFLEETVLLLWNSQESNLNFCFLFNSHVRDVGRNLMLTIIPEKSSLSSDHTDWQFKSYWLKYMSVIMWGLLKQIPHIIPWKVPAVLDCEKTMFSVVILAIKLPSSWSQ